MGCGQSQFSLIHPKKHKRKARRNKDCSDDESDEDEEDKFRRSNGRLISSRSTPNLFAALQNHEYIADTPNISPFDQFHNTSLLAHREMSSSQYDFFKTLDEKIQNGPDYDEFSEKERQLENVRTRQLLTEWERAKQKRQMMNQAMMMTSIIVQQSSSHQTPPPSGRNVSSRVCPRLPGSHQTQFITPSLPKPLQNGQLVGPCHQTYKLNKQRDHRSPAQNNQTARGQSLSNSIVMYDEARGQFYTELA